MQELDYDSKQEYGDLIFKIKVDNDIPHLLWISKLDRKYYYTINFELDLLDAIKGGNTEF